MRTPAACYGRAGLPVVLAVWPVARWGEARGSELAHLSGWRWLLLAVGWLGAQCATHTKASMRAPAARTASVASCTSWVDMEGVEERFLGCFGRAALYI